MEAGRTGEVELEPDVAEPWLPGLQNPAVAWPMGVGAIFLAAAAFVMNVDRGALTALMCALLAASLVVLSVTDVQVRRLPDEIVLPLWGLLLAVGFLAGLLQGADWVRAFGCSAVCYAVLWIAALFSGGMGWGDVKLGGVIALVLGMEGWAAAFLGTLFLPMAIGGVPAVLRLIAGERGGSMAFGPYLAAGALLLLLFPGSFTTLFGFPPDFS